MRLRWRALTDQMTLGSGDTVLAWTDDYGIAADAAGTRTFYPDSSGQDLTTDPAVAPTYIDSAFADKGAVRFTAANDGLDSSPLRDHGKTLAAGLPRTVALVARVSSDSQGGQVFGLSNNNRIALGDGSNQRINLRRSSPSDLTWCSATDSLARATLQTVVVTADDNGTQIYINGSLSDNTSDQLFHYELSHQLAIGTGLFYGRDFIGDLAEIILIDEALDAAQVNDLSQRLSQYYSYNHILAPTHIEVEMADRRSVTLSWNDPQNCETIIIQQQASDGEWDTIATVAAGTESWTHTGCYRNRTGLSASGLVCPRRFTVD